MAAKRVVIAGGGMGGVAAASILRKRLGKEHKIILIDKATHFTYAPAFLSVMLGKRERGQITRPLQRLTNKGIDVANTEVTSIDIGKRKILAGAEEIAFDYLIVALGAELNPEGLDGYADSAHSFYDLPGAIKLKGALENFSGGKIALLISSLPYKCPAAPYEGALLVASHLKKKGLKDTVELRVFTPEPQPLPVAGPVVGDAVKKMMAEREINLHTEAQATKVDSAKKEILFADGATASFDLLIGVPPHQSPKVVRESGMINGGGWISVDRQTMKTEHEGIYAIGDVASVMMPVGKPLPKAGVFAHYQAEIIAHNIAAEINGSGSTRSFDGHGSCFVETGDGRAGYVKGQFFAPKPDVHLKPPARRWRAAKVLFEKYWLWRWF